MAVMERLAGPVDIDLEKAPLGLAPVGKEALLVERLAAEVKADRIGPAELPALLENLAARLAQLANPKDWWRAGRAAELLDEERMLLAREAALVERLAIELKAGALQPGELPALLENLGARLSMLADPASPWKGIGKRRG